PSGPAPAGAIRGRVETRWVKPVRPGDTIQPTGIIKSKQVTRNSRWVLIDVMVHNQGGEKVATGEAMVAFRAATASRALFRDAGRSACRPPAARGPRDAIRARRNDIA